MLLFHCPIIVDEYGVRDEYMTTVIYSQSKNNADEQSVTADNDATSFHRFVIAN